MKFLRRKLTVQANKVGLLDQCATRDATDVFENRKVCIKINYMTGSGENVQRKCVLERTLKGSFFGSLRRAHFG